MQMVSITTASATYADDCHGERPANKKNSRLWELVLPTDRFQKGMSIDITLLT